MKDKDDEGDGEKYSGCTKCAGDDGDMADTDADMDSDDEIEDLPPAGAEDGGDECDDEGGGGGGADVAVRSSKTDLTDTDVFANVFNNRVCSIRVTRLSVA